MAAKKIVIFPTDFSKVSVAALPWAIRMAKLMDGEVHVLYVVEEPHIYATLDMGPVPIPSADELASSASTRLDRFVSDNVREVSAVGKVLTGRPADEIVEYASEHGAELIVMTTHGYSGVKHVLLGSTTESVLRSASCPVLSVRGTA
ncbi:MAG: universal stress protein [Chromatiales bacterium]|nr:universal stress protein [Chromatiales bacterium]